MHSYIFMFAVLISAATSLVFGEESKREDLKLFHEPRVTAQGAVSLSQPMGEVNLGYHSGSGWQLSGGGYVAADSLGYMLGSHRLIPEGNGVSPQEFRSPAQPTMRAYFYDSDSVQQSYWRVVDEIGNVEFYQTRLLTSDGTKVRRWLKSKRRDRSATTESRYLYELDHQKGAFYLTSVVSGRTSCAPNSYTLTSISYESIPERFQSINFKSGYPVQFQKRPKAVTYWMGADAYGGRGEASLKWRWVLDYVDEVDAPLMNIESVKLYGTDALEPGAKASGAVEFSYHEGLGLPKFSDQRKYYPITTNQDLNYIFTDFDHDGIKDQIGFNGKKVEVYQGQAPGGFASEPMLKSDGDQNAKCQYLDFDGDGRVDCVEKVGQILLYSPLGNDGFEDPRRLETSSSYTLGEMQDSRMVSGLLDFNGDGLSDYLVTEGNNLKVLFNRGGRFEDPKVFEMPDVEGIRRIDDSGHITHSLMDLNGDGLADRLFKANGELKVSFNVGQRFSAPYEFELHDDKPLYELSPNAIKAGWRDIDGDGLQDRITLREDGVFVALNLGGGFREPVFLHQSLGADGVFEFSDSCEGLDLTDLNGDRVLDRYKTTCDKIVVWEGNSSPSGLLKGVHNSFGGVEEFHYERVLSHPKARGLPTWVLSAQTRHYGFARHSDVTTTRYQYDAPIFADDHKFIAFALETKTSPTGVIYEEHYFREGPFLGLHKKSVTKGPDNSIFQIDEKIYQSFQLLGRGHTYSLLAGERSFIFDGADKPTILAKSYSYDSQGFLTVLDDLGQVDLTPDGEVSDPYPDNRQVRNRFYHIPSKGLYGLLKEEVTLGLDTERSCAFDVRECLELQKHVRVLYDGLPYGEVGVGLESERKRRTSEGFVSLGSQLYDVHGNVKQKVYPDGTVERTSYDSRFCAHPTVKTVTDSYGGEYVTTSSYDDWGDLISTEKSGLKTTYSYDRYRRPLKVEDGNSAGVARKVRYFTYDAANQNPGGRVEYIATSQVNWEKITYLDGFGRVIQEKQTSPEGGGTYLVHDYRYEVKDGRVITTKSRAYTSNISDYELPKSLGVLEQVSNYLVSGAESGKVTETVDQKGVRSFMIVEGLQVKHLDKNRKIRKIETKDGLGNIILVTEFAESGEIHDTIRLTYLTAEGLSRGLSSTNYWVKMGYNLLGQKVIAEDPVSGVEVLGYNLSGQQVFTLDAKGQVTHLTYDGFGRPTQKRFGLGQGVIAADFRAWLDLPVTQVPTDVTAKVKVSYHRGQEVTFRYDESGHGHSKGQLTSVDYPGGRDEAFYNNQGKVSRSVKTIAGKSFEVFYGYNLLGKLATAQFPGGEQVDYGYTSAGKVARVAYTKVSSKNRRTVPIADVDGLFSDNGMISGLRYGNGIMTSYDYQEDHSGGQIPSLLAMKASGKHLEFHEDFGYDEFGQTVSISGSDGFAAYDYDFFGRLKKTNNAKVSVGKDGNLSQLRGKVYGRVASELEVRDSAGHVVRRIDYDALGQQSSSWQAGRLREFSYDYDGRLVGVAENGRVLSESRYDAAGQRVLLKEGGLTTYMVAPNYHVVFDAAGKQVSSTLKIGFYGQTVSASKNGEIHYLVNDLRGNTRRITDEGGKVLGRFQFDAFGKMTLANDGSGVEFNRADLWSLVHFSGFQIDQATGLYLFKDRFYDPTQGRFLTPDTVIPGSMSRSLNRYSFCYNNPMTYSDPSGHIPILAPLIAFITANISTIAATIAAVAGVASVVFSAVGEALDLKWAKVTGMVFAGVSFVMGGLSGSLAYGKWADAVARGAIEASIWKQWGMYAGNLMLQGVIVGGANFFVKGVMAGIDYKQSPIDWKTTAITSAINFAFGAALGVAWDVFATGFTSSLNWAIGRSAGWFNVLLRNFKQGWGQSLIGSIRGSGISTNLPLVGGSRAASIGVQMASGATRMGLFHVMCSAMFTPAYAWIATFDKSSWEDGDTAWSLGVEANWGFRGQAWWLAFTFSRGTVLPPSGVNPIFNSLGAIGDIVFQYLTYEYWGEKKKHN